MPKSGVTQAEMFNDDYEVIGQYRTDDDRIPYYNPEDSGVTVLPGEPMLIDLGGNDYVYMAQGPIPPGSTGYLVKRFKASFPCSLSVTVEEGTEIYWDPLNTTGSAVGTAVVEGDANPDSFRIGFASYDYNSNPNVDKVLGSNDRIVAGTTASTRIDVISLDGMSAIKSAPTTTAAPTTTTTTTTTAP